MFIPALFVVLPLLHHGADDALERVLDPKVHHLGNDPTPDWKEASEQPEGMTLHLDFEARENASERVLVIYHWDLDNDWTLALNGKPILVLEKGKDRIDHFYRVPAGALKTGTNALDVTAQAGSQDDMIIGNVRYFDAPLQDVLHFGYVEARVTDADTGAPIPARVTIDDGSGKLPSLFDAASKSTAIRPGVAYTKDGAVKMSIPAAKLRVTATRGMEWGLDQKWIDVKEGETTTVDLKIRREVDTRGFVAADTHIHTLTFSGHGDSSIEERMVTLAGEGVELAVATDHNHDIDYQPYQSAAGLSSFFTSVVGNEVTTEVGHFNAFPLDPKDKIPDYTLKDWVKLVDGMRAHGAKVVTLNHPRWPTVIDSPFAWTTLDPDTGTIHGQELTVDATELANAGCLLDDPLALFRDWFALLDHGYKLGAVASSDSHTVGEPVGQGRSYVPSKTDDPSAIDVDAACDGFKRGANSIAVGIFADVHVNGGSTMGDLVSAAHAKTIAVKLRVASAAWIRPRRALFFIDGAQVFETMVMTQVGKPTDVTIEVAPPIPAHDAWLVCVVLGDGVDGPWWRPAAKDTIGATNPVFLDVDGDGKYTAPRATGIALAESAKGDVERLCAAIVGVDNAVAIQAIDGALAAAPDAAAKDALLARLKTVCADRPRVAAFVERMAHPQPPAAQQKTK